MAKKPTPLYDNPKSPKDEDARDFSGKFNTELTEDEEKAYGEWITKQGAAHGRDLSKDNYDYDTRGQFKELGGKDLEKGHGPDTHKKPNHPTFSTDSKYHGKDAKGGQWAKKDGRDTFTPGEENLKHRSPDELRNYFKQVEPNADLVLPEAE